MKIYACIAFGLVIAGCISTSSNDAGASGSERIERVREFRALTEAGEWERARKLVASEPRRWWNEKSGEGQPWVVGPNGGRWAHWDEYFGSDKEILDLQDRGDSVSVVIREINDYYRLLDRGAMTNEAVYYFDEDGRIAGLLIRGIGERPAGKTDEFIAWSRAQRPGEIEALMPGGEIDPTGDHPERFRRLLEEWRSAEGLPPIN